MKIVKPDITWGGGLTPLDPRKVDMVVLHHMAHKTWTFQEVHDYHKNSNGWFGVGYNFWISFDGEIYEGRGYNQGAHCKGYNDHTIGVGFQGDLEQQDMTDEQVEAVVWLIRNKLMSKFHQIDHKAIRGHYDLANTSCPGKQFRMKEVVEGVKNGMSTKDKPSKWAEKSWEKATKKGVFDGARPKEPLTRQEYAVILDRKGELD